MAIKNKTKEVKDRINEMLEKRNEDLKIIEEKEAEARAELHSINEKLKKAADNFDADTYKTASTEKREVDLTLEMLRDKRNIIQSQAYITEKESDAVIDSLLKYEDDLAAEFEKSIAEPMQKLTEIYKKYGAEILETESTITLWTNKIHAYYKTTAGQRSEKPQLVHRLPYTGYARAERLRSFLIKEKYFDGHLNADK